MGEAKRRKKLDPNFGQDQLEVRLKPDLDLPRSLKEIRAILIRKKKEWEVGEVSVKGTTYPVIFMPFTKYYQGRLKLYSQVAFANESHPRISQKLIDRISMEVCRHLRDKYEKEEDGQSKI